jgi:Leucine-rich repeat
MTAFLCPGHNEVRDLPSVGSLRRLRRLRLLNLVGNPVCADGQYRPFVLSHVAGLVYFDYRRVSAAEAAAAREQFQVIAEMRIPLMAAK